jgi:hypothetical protein
MNFIFYLMLFPLTYTFDNLENPFSLSMFQTFFKFQSEKKISFGYGGLL